MSHRRNANKVAYLRL